uniref:Uncharacterized protein LOC116956132 n=1 Tax=Petromyzon marinus TaxID=7757 RepID=A0AAJ7UCZ4_PETMA|nr:uncharacterized protein LOC116956132 [Petromyzon marinus]
MAAAASEEELPPAVDVDPRGDFTGWLGAQGVKPGLARTLATDLGIADYDCLLACTEDAEVRSELLAVAKERLPFAHYAIFRRVVNGVPPRRQPHPAARGASATSEADIRRTLGTVQQLTELVLSVQRLTSPEAFLNSLSASTHGRASSKRKAGSSTGTATVMMRRRCAQQSAARASRYPVSGGASERYEDEELPSVVINHQGIAVYERGGDAGAGAGAGGQVNNDDGEDDENEEEEEDDEEEDEEEEEEEDDDIANRAAYDAYPQQPPLAPLENTNGQEQLAHKRRKH